MIRKGQVFVRAQDPTGKWGSADVLDLDDESFRVVVLTAICRSHMIAYLEVDGPEITLHCRTPFPKDD